MGWSARSACPALHKKRRVSDRTYAKVQQILGDGGVVELLAIMGSYTLTCMVLHR